MRTLSTTEYPPLLREINDPPEQLYMEGSLAPEDHTHLTVVGSRYYSDYGKAVLEDIMRGLRGYPISIVSGLAIGIDRLAHEAALENGLHTVAVPGSGLHRSVLYPARHRKLANRIFDAGGALISEFAPTERASKRSFPQRNRIMAGISPATLVVEAAQDSGTLITAQLATDYNRDILAVPGSIFSPNTYGPHMLIRLGAVPVIKSEHVLEALEITPETRREAECDLGPDEQRVIKILAEPHSRDALIQKLGLSASDANILLSMMELREYIIEQNGYIRTKI